MKAIVAINNKGYIGKGGKMMWHSLDDFNHFKTMTMGCKLMVGRVTHEEMPPLEGREIIVVGKGHHTLEEALAKKPDWVIGGAKLYVATLHLCSSIHISFINDNQEGDVEFPECYSMNGKVFHYYFEPNPLKFEAREIPCVTCGFKIIEIHPTGGKMESGMWNGGIVDMIVAGYGSNVDGSVYHLGICDNCIPKLTKSGQLLYSHNYMRGERRDDGQ